MAHPYHEHRDHKVQHRRVHHIAKGYAHGGAVEHDDVAEDTALIKKTVKKAALRMDGGRVKHRADRPARGHGGRLNKVDGRERKHDLNPYEGGQKRAKGGRTKHKGKTVINIVNAHPGGGGVGPAAPPMMPPGLPPRPPLPMAAPPAAPPLAGPPPGAMPPGAMPPRPMPPMAPAGGPPLGLRRSGGRTYARGGGVKDGPAFAEGMRARPVEHHPGKQDTKNIGRGRQVTFWAGGGANKKRARGGPVEAPHHPAKGLGPIDHPQHGGMTPNFQAGSGGGTARMKKIAFARKAQKHLP